MAEDGIKINGKHYDIPPSMRVGETRTIKRLTGLNPPEFMLELARLSDTQDPDVGAAMVWWIVHREDPSFTIDQVDELEWAAIEGEGEPDPKASVATSDSASVTTDSSPTSATGSSSTSDPTAGCSTPESGGVPVLAHSGLST